VPIYDVYLKDPKRSPFDPWQHVYRPVFGSIEANNKDHVKDLWENFKATDKEFGHMIIDEIKIANQSFDSDVY